jgi:hypothetical protein
MLSDDISIILDRHALSGISFAANFRSVIDFIVGR